ncbi:hypothetical protein B1222_10470 [Paenibacillus larvae subsp. pulvifaciens]|uniref:Uncharacterized protein n=1 Tax=Paenibacillus larvae subsp. pulvifaciens TaxID=1477 RepID=A0A1U9YMR5_9BACL|nr:DUF4318 domain-containing protein [Paenibacillus larvae]AQT84719.1 hypothetical protein B1222_10470 [Paenibacillus larvae subsp. pulvifaciens]AQZ46717.1 hypothetical protein B5S25_08945 [Paenibacillus larvae subsp. pulvifaciens]ARF68122.1 hypothetical protein B7C51_10210 [Paenibacillus larvae subsp. pulvifaciens]MBH0342424.1 hypothetical protein [Paenibacillus larvae]MCY7522136.1 DUF4318 domain-containing protein [Paenibacillus larvae]
MKIRKRSLKRFFKKGFFIELDEALTYPSVQTTCEAIEKYAAESGQEVEFVSKGQPVTFYLAGKIYYVEISMARGGYYLFCREV